MPHHISTRYDNNGVLGSRVDCNKRDARWRCVENSYFRGVDIFARQELEHLFAKSIRSDISD